MASADLIFCTFRLETPHPVVRSDAHFVCNVVCKYRPLGSINRFKKIDRRSVQNARLLHRVFKISRSDKVLSLLRVLSVEDDNDLALIAIGG